MTTFHDIIWGPDKPPDYMQEYVKDRLKHRRDEWTPADEQLAREVAQSRLIAQRDRERRERELRREFVRDGFWALLGLALMFFALWIVAPMFGQ